MSSKRKRDKINWAIFLVVAVVGTVYLVNFANVVAGTLTNISETKDDYITTDNLYNMKKLILETSLGDIEMELYPDEAPNTVKNFVKLAEEEFYNGTRFHRVIKDFMVQGGDPLSKDVAMKDRWGTGGPGYAFADEFNEHKVVRGALAMANSGPGTNGSQFFIVTAGETPWLDGKHTVFGMVVSGMNVVDAIEDSITDERDRPVKDVVIEKVIIK